MNEISTTILLPFLHKLDIKSLINICRINIKFRNICKSDRNLKNRIYGYLLFKRDVNLMSEDDKFTLLTFNAKINNVKRVKFLCDYTEMKHKQVALINASFSGHLSLVQYFIEICKCKIDFQNDGSLSSAINGKRWEVVKYLISLGAKTKTILFSSVLDSLIKQGNLDMIKLLFNCGVKIQGNYLHKCIENAEKERFHKISEYFSQMIF